MPRTTDAQGRKARSAYTIHLSVSERSTGRYALVQGSGNGFPTSEDWLLLAREPDGWHVLLAFYVPFDNVYDVLLLDDQEHPDQVFVSLGYHMFFSLDAGRTMKALSPEEMALIRLDRLPYISANAIVAARADGESVLITVEGPEAGDTTSLLRSREGPLRQYVWRVTGTAEPPTLLTDHPLETRTVHASREESDPIRIRGDELEERVDGTWRAVEVDRIIREAGDAPHDFFSGSGSRLA